jgi:membrane protein implicated in regulation of membrane protease activity
MVFFWLIVAVAAAIGEVMTTGLFLGTVAVAALATAVISLVVPSLTVELAIFAGLSLAGISVLRPLLVRTLGMDTLIPDAEPMRHPHVVGRRAVVTREVDSHSGQIRIGESEFWTARAYDPADRMPVGATVEVMVVDGLTALVAPLVSLPGPNDGPDPLDSLNTDKGASA